MLAKLARYYPIQLELIPLMLLAFNLYVVLSNYSVLPDKVPTHFDINGAVDGWGGKGEILVFPIVGALVYFLFTGINLAFAVVKDPRGLVNLPQKAKAAMSPQAAEKLRIVMLRDLLALKMLIIGLITFMAYASIQVALGRAEGLGAIWFAVFMAAIIVLIGLMLFQALRLVYARPTNPDRSRS